VRWEDERYIRFYTRNTPEWLALSLAARGLMGLLLREVDRAGILRVGKLGLRGVAVAVRAPWVEVEGPLQELIDDGCVVAAEGHVLVRNFIEAQEARSSDKARQKKAREVARDLAVVTLRDAIESPGVILVSQNTPPESHAVTRGHTVSHGVTPSCAVPSLAVPSLEEASAPLALVPPTAEPKKSKAKMKTHCPLSDATPETVAAWARAHGLPPPSADPEFGRMLDWHRKEARASADWGASWRTWKNPERTNPRAGPRGVPRQSTPPNAPWLPKETM
jgi:hypothetical protein